MKLCIISGSTREDAASCHVAEYLKSQLTEISPNGETSIFDLAQLELPLWQEGMDETVVSEQKQQLANADGFVFVVPEWHGMVPPAVKNLFFLFGNVFKHKPAYIVGVSSGTGGRYPIVEMRASTYKNSMINYLPISTVLDKVNTVISKQGEYIAEKDFMKRRLDEGLRFLIEYSKAFIQIRESEIAKESRFANGL
ncbi:MAG: NAD(P)H-dependent oxidoreductase [Gammaproteobacteria bacterium]|nr:NAD(P)H-dependent oxidoreductase [Gammaproteobacteria bacterium]